MGKQKKPVIDHMVEKLSKFEHIFNRLIKEGRNSVSITKVEKEQLTEIYRDHFNNPTFKPCCNHNWLRQLGGHYFKIKE